MYIHGCVCVCMSMYMCVCMSMYMCVCMSVCVHVYAVSPLYQSKTQSNLCVCACLHTLCVCAYVHTWVCVCVHVYVHNVCVCVCVPMYMGVCVCMSIYICVLVHAGKNSSKQQKCRSTSRNTPAVTSSLRSSCFSSSTSWVRRVT